MLKGHWPLLSQWWPHGEQGPHTNSSWDHVCAQDLFQLADPSHAMEYTCIKRELGGLKIPGTDPHRVNILSP